MAELDWIRIVAIAASGIALALALRAGTEGRRTAALHAELEELRSETRGTRKEREKREKALRKAEAELDKASRKVAQADKRSAQHREAARGEREAAAQRTQTLELQIDEAGREVETLRRDLARATLQLDAATQHVAKAETRAVAAEEARAESARVLAARPPPADPAELVALGQRVQTAERERTDHAASLAKATAEIERLKAKVETQDTLYTSIRSELSLKKDQIRQQREELERLLAYKVALVDTPLVDTDASETPRVTD